MEFVIFLLLVLAVGYFLHRKAQAEILQQRDIFNLPHISENTLEPEDIELLNTVSSMFRGTPSERFLIVSLLKYGIKAKAIFHDLYVFKPNGKTSQIDVVIATNVGIIVFEVKDYSGWIYGNGNQQKWTQVLSHGREKYHFYNPILQNEVHISQLKRVLKENIPFYSIKVFAGNCKLEDISFIPKNTFVTKLYRVVEVIENIINNNPVANYKDKRKVINILSKAVNNGQNNDVAKKHISNIKEMLGEDRVFK